MRYIMTGKNMDISDRLKEQIETKIGRLQKLFPENTDVYVTVSLEKMEHIIEVTVPLKKRILRGEVSSFDMYAAIDEVVDVLEKQMVKYKSRLRDRVRKDVAFKEELNQLMGYSEAAEADEPVIKIEKSKKFALKPMDAEEAVMEMELLGHVFFVFRNGDTDEVNVVYKRKNGTYVLIEPEF